ncbi:MAG: glycine zipper 2TM domain-containing protein [Rhizobacter sp.]
MDSSTQNVAPGTPATRSVPRAAWIAGGLLCLLTAGLAGAWVTKSVDSSSAAPAATLMAEAKTAPAAVPTPGNAACPNCGVVESVTAVKQKGQGTGLGAVTGGVLGGVVGNQFGSGSGRTAMTVLGAVGGGVAGHEVEKQVRSETHFNVKVRMDDGTMRTFRRTQTLPVGASVKVDGDNLSVIQNKAP